MNKIKEFLADEKTFLDEMYDISFELEMEDFFREHGRAPTYEEMSRGY